MTQYGTATVVFVWQILELVTLGLLIDAFLRMKKFESVGQYSLKKKLIVLQIAANLAYFVAELDFFPYFSIKFIRFMTGALVFTCIGDILLLINLIAIVDMQV